MKAPFSRAYLFSRLHYDPLTGIWTRLAHYKGAAGNIMPTGYRRIRVGKGRYLSHVLAWFYMTGKWPAKIVDHKDNDKFNTKWDNFRLATRVQNRVNCKCRADNKTKLKGVSPRGKNMWQASITVAKKRVSLGTFSTPERAHAAYCAAAAKHFKEFARFA